ncbi:MAG: hypothetical protein WC343_01395 [Bacilli bacterium]|jgi:uncharacterized membrane protein
MQVLILFVACFILIYSIYKIVFFFQLKKHKKDLYMIVEISSLKRIFKVDVDKISLNRLLNIVSLTDALIFSVVLVATMAIGSYIIRLIVMFLLLMPIIYVAYYLLSKYLKKKGNKRNV